MGTLMSTKIRFKIHYDFPWLQCNILGANKGLHPLPLDQTEYSTISSLVQVHLWGTLATVIPRSLAVYYLEGKYSVNIAF